MGQSTVNLETISLGGIFQEALDIHGLKYNNLSRLRKRWKSSMKALREVLQDIKKLHIEAEPKANEIIHIKEEKKEN